MVCSQRSCLDTPSHVGQKGLSLAKLRVDGVPPNSTNHTRQANTRQYRPAKPKCLRRTVLS
eukprot:2817335-Alexandrium_andersonii.AAC.1